MNQLIISGVRYKYIFFLQSGGASQWRVCYQGDLPRLVFLPFYCCRFLQGVFLYVDTAGTRGLSAYSTGAHTSTPHSE